MSFTRFEEMTCALLDKEPGVTRADLYNTRFDAQYGIDCFGDLPGGMIVASCKCQKSIKKDEMAKWSEDFLQHWEAIWKKQGVSKFILSTAAPTEHRNRLADIATQKKRFEAIGVEYEVWSPRQLQEHLRAHRGLVSQYVGPDFVSILCGEDTVLLGEAQAVQSALEERLDDLGSALSSEVEQRFAIAKQILEQGAITKAQPLVESLRRQTNWSSLPPDLRARIIRLQASIELSQEDIAAATGYADEADALAPSDEPRLRANIALYAAGSARALEVLGEPKTEPGRAFRANLFLTQWRLDEARAILATLSDTPEKMRLEGLRLLFSGDRPGAKRIADAAMARFPDNLHIRRLGVMVRYSLALSDLAVPQQYVFGSPFPSPLLRIDNDSTASLLDALRLCDDIIAQGEPISARLDWPWRLACLCNLADKRAEAAAQARELLADDPVNAAAIGWILVRGIPVELTTSRDALWAQLRDGTLDPSGPRALEWTSDPVDRDKLLEAVTNALGAHPWSDDVRSELETLRGRLGGDSELEGEAAAARRLEAAISSKQTSAVIVEFRLLLEEKPTPILLLAAAEVLAQAEEWTVLSEGLTEILAFKTAQAVQLAAYAAFNSGDALQTLSILSANAGVFPGSRLPYDLRRMEAQALLKAGDGQQALARAEALVAETQQMRDRLWEARIRLDVGDLRGAANTIRAASTTEQFKPQEALWWAGRFVHEDVELARALWRSATSSGPLPDAIAASAYHLSFELGVEHEKPELAAVLPRMAAAGAPGVQLVSMDDLAAFISESRERTSNLDELLTKGDVPIHLVSRAANTSLAEIYWLGDGSEPGLRPVFLRSAARVELPSEQPWKEWILYIDVTALLIADQLGLLGHIEGHDKRPRIGRSTIAALLSIEERVRHPQPSRVAAAEAVLKEIGRGIRIIPPADCARVVHQPGEGQFGPAAVLASLHAGGWIDDTSAANARKNLNIQEHVGPVPSARQPLLFAEQTLDLLAGAHLLPAVIEAFDAYIDPDSLELTRGETLRGARSSALVSWISKLRDRVGRGLQSGAYVYAEKEAEPADEDAKQDPVYVSLLEILRSSEADGHNRLWIDDRLLTSYKNAGQSRVVGIVEVLDALRGGGTIDDDLYFESLRKLRNGGALFIPVTVDEISRHLSKAPLVGASIVETPGLTAIRRNIGLALSFQDALRLGPQQVGGELRPSELPYLMDLRRLIEGVVIDRWNSGADLSLIRAQCDWVWRALRTEQPPRSKGGQPPRDSVSFAALNIAGLINSVMHLKGSGRAGHARRKEYFEWIESTVVNTRFEGDAKLAEGVGNLTRTLLRLDKAEGVELDDAARQSLRKTTKLIVYELPTALREVVASDEAFRRDLGIEAGGVLTIEKRDFLAEEFWKGVQTATNGAASEIETADRDGKIIVQPPSEDWVFPISGVMTVKMSEPAAGLLSDDETVRNAGFAKALVDLDIPASGTGGIREALDATKTANEKMRAVAEYREQSIPYFLQQLSTSLDQSTNIQLGRFRPPAAAHWLRFLRWQQVDGDAICTSIMAAKSDLGIGEAARRYCALPISLPRDVELELERIPASSLTLMGRIHRLHSLRLSGVAANPALADASDEAVQACLEHGALLVALLRWGARCFMQQEDWPMLSVGEKHAIIWCYAECLTEVLVSVGADANRTAEIFNEHLTVPPARALKLEAGYDNSPLLAGALSQAGILLVSCPINNFT
jgi:hypothetical protein